MDDTIQKLSEKLQEIDAQKYTLICDAFDALMKRYQHLIGKRVTLKIKDCDYDGVFGGFSMSQLDRRIEPLLFCVNDKGNATKKRVRVLILPSDTFELILNEE